MCVEWQENNGIFYGLLHGQLGWNESMVLLTRAITPFIWRGQLKSSEESKFGDGKGRALGVLPSQT